MADKKVLIIGGGTAGLAAARTLAQAGLGVHIVEKNSFLGGHALGYTCKAAKECLQCGACSVEALLKEVSAAPGITTDLSTTITKVEKENGFKVTLRKKPAYIDPKKCDNCGLCYEKAPVAGSVERGYSQNNHPLYAINPEMVSECGSLPDICPQGAINLKSRTSSKTVRVQAVIVASGFKPFDPAIKSTYGYGKFPNVISGLDLERNKRENGALLRPSDGQEAKKIAFIQCVGSRDERLGNLWCSRVCCPYALRTAKAVKHQLPEAEITIFYMDIQSFGKEFPTFYESCQEELQFVRTIPVDVFPAANDDLSIRFLDEDGSSAIDNSDSDQDKAEDEETAAVAADGLAVYNTFDLLVLSVGITPNPDNSDLAELLQLGLDQDGFFSVPEKQDAVGTSQPGIFVAGTARQPQNIEASIAQANQAAHEAVKYLGE